MSTDILWW